jgi:hypothetical protein
MEKDIIYKAIEALKKTTGILGIFRENGPFGGMLEMDINGYNHSYVIEVKQELRTYQLEQIRKNFHRYENYMLVANRIFPKIKEEIRTLGIPYLEANGNIFLKKEGQFLFVDTQKPLEPEKNKGNRAFTKTGLRVLFYLLQHKEAIHLPQRVLAEKTDVALGNIPQVIEGLKETGFLIPLNNKSYVWENRELLFDRWVIEYATVLRPKLRKERFVLKRNWKEMQFDDQKTVWGAEPAADILTNHLRPEKFLIYTKETRMELIKNYGLMPDKNGEVEVLEMFWNNKTDKSALPILIYADLITEGGKRNKETAEKIYNEYIKPNI